MNKIILMGRLTRDPELRTTQTGKSVAQFTLAVDRPFKNPNGEQEADFIPVVAWGRTAELCGQYLNKGRQAIVEGRMQVRSYEAKDGGRRWVTEVVADRVEFIGGRNDNGAAKPASGMEQFGQVVNTPATAQELPFGESVPF